MDRDQGDDAVVLDVGNVDRALPDERALAVLKLGVGPGIERGLVDRAAFDLRQQAVADADHFEAQLGDIDGGDRHAFGIVARQDDAAGETDQRGLVAQFDRDGLVLGQLLAIGGGEARLQRDVVGRVEIQA